MFNFPSGTHRTLISKLSGGEKRRLFLIKTLITNPNFLILDEPTNDLDLDTMRRLEDYVLNFSGTLIVVSHDRAFLDRTTDFLFVFDGQGKIKGFTGNYSEYREFISMTKLSSKTKKKDNADNNKVLEHRDQTYSTKRKLSFRENREFETIESEIADLEAEKNKLESLFSKTDKSLKELETNNRRYKIVSDLIETKLARWEELAEIAD